MALSAGTRDAVGIAGRRGKVVAGLLTPSVETSLPGKVADLPKSLVVDPHAKP